MTDTDAIIVGAGHNGLVAAFYLANAGLRVSVFESRSWVGGAATTEELWPGMRFSTCAHYLQFVPPKIWRDMKLAERGVYVIPRPFRLHLRPDGSYWEANQDSPRNAAVKLTADERTAMAKWEKFKDSLFAALAPFRLRVPPTLEEFRGAIQSTPVERTLEQCLSHRLHELQDQYLPTESLKSWHIDEGAAVGRNPLALNLGYFSAGYPYQADSTGHEPQLPQIGSVRGGMGRLTEAMAAAVEEAGATIHLNHPVRNFLVEKGQVVGVRLGDGTEVRSRVVLSNLDPKRTFLRMFKPTELDEKFRVRVDGLRNSISSYKFLAEISELPHWKQWDGDADLPSTGCVRMGVTRPEAYAAYDDLEAGVVPRRPMINFTVPSSVDPSITNPGSHTASIWIFPIPPRLKKGSWDDVKEEVAERLIDQINEYAPNFKASVQRYVLRTPLDLERENGLTDGSIWHLHHDGDMLFWNRPLPELAHYRAPLASLYLCGAGQHTGGEVSGIPGHNCAREVMKDLNILDQPGRVEPRGR